MTFAFNILLSAVVIGICSWISKRSPQLAGFIIALPISSMLVLALGNSEQRDPQKMISLAKSIVVALPLSLLFFIPFFFAEKLRLSFWMTYASGVALLACGYFIHRLVLR